MTYQHHFGLNRVHFLTSNTHCSARLFDPFNRRLVEGLDKVRGRPQILPDRIHHKTMHPPPEWPCEDVSCKVRGCRLVGQKVRLLRAGSDLPPRNAPPDLQARRL